MAAKKKAAEKSAEFRWVFSFKGSQRKYPLDPGKLTLAERIEIEEWLGMPLGQARASGWMDSEKGYAILATIARRKREPEWTLTQTLACEGLEMEVNTGDPPTKTRASSGAEGSET